MTAELEQLRLLADAIRAERVAKAALSAAKSQSAMLAYQKAVREVDVKLASIEEGKKDEPQQPTHPAGPSKPDPGRPAHSRG